MSICIPIPEFAQELANLFPEGAEIGRIVAAIGTALGNIINGYDGTYLLNDIAILASCEGILVDGLGVHRKGRYTYQDDMAREISNDLKRAFSTMMSLMGYYGRNMFFTLDECEDYDISWALTIPTGHPQKPRVRVSINYEDP